MDPGLYGLFRYPGTSAWQKPPYSYIALITMAISSKPDRKMTLNQVNSSYRHLGKSPSIDVHLLF